MVAAVGPSETRINIPAQELNYCAQKVYGISRGAICFFTTGLLFASTGAGVMFALADCNKDNYYLAQLVFSFGILSIGMGFGTLLGRARTC